MNVLFGNVKSDCRPKYLLQTAINNFKKMYVDTFRDRQLEKSYPVSDKYKWVNYFNYKLPCGTKEYHPGLPILNGTDAPEKSWPWQVLLDFPRRYCGGALIDAQWILTAAHCVDDKDEYCTVYFGSIYRDFRDQVQSRSPTLVVLHDEFDNSTLANDIALLKLDSPVDFTEKVRPACLPVYGQEFSLNDRCYITGYGETNNPGPNVLQQLRVHVVPSTECAYLWQLRSVSRDWRDICVGSVRQSGRAGYGDSGGPLSCETGNRYYVTGVVSASTPDSLFDLIPDKYVKVSEYINWIFHTIETFFK